MVWESGYCLPEVICLAAVKFTRRMCCSHPCPFTDMPVYKWWTLPAMVEDLTRIRAKSTVNIIYFHIYLLMLLKKLLLGFKLSMLIENEKFNFNSHNSYYRHQREQGYLPINGGNLTLQLVLLQAPILHLLPKKVLLQSFKETQIFFFLLQNFSGKSHCHIGISGIFFNPSPTELKSFVHLQPCKITFSVASCLKWVLELF